MNKTLLLRISGGIGIVTGSMLLSLNLDSGKIFMSLINLVMIVCGFVLFLQKFK